MLLLQYYRLVVTDVTVIQASGARCCYSITRTSSAVVTVLHASGAVLL